MFWKKSKEIEQLYKDKRELLEQLETEKHKSAHYFTKAEKFKKKLKEKERKIECLNSIIETSSRMNASTIKYLNDEILKLKEKAGDL